MFNEQTLHELEISDGETNVAAISFRLALETALASAVIDEYANVVEDDFFTQTTKPLVIEAVRERIRNNAAYFKSGSGNRDLRQSPLGKAIGTLHSPYLTSHINAWEKALLAKDFDLGVRGLGFILTVDGAQRTNIASGLWSDYLSFMRTRAMLEIGRVDEVIGTPLDTHEAVTLLNGEREDIDEWFNVREASTQVLEETTDRNVLKLIYYGQYFGLLGHVFREVAGEEEWEKWVQEVCIDNATDRSRDWYDFALYAKTILEDRVSMLKIRLDAEEKTLGKRLFREKLPTVKGQPSADQLRAAAKGRGKGKKKR